MLVQCGAGPPATLPSKAWKRATRASLLGDKPTQVRISRSSCRRPVPHCRATSSIRKPPAESARIRIAADTCVLSEAPSKRCRRYNSSASNQASIECAPADCRTGCAALSGKLSAQPPRALRRPIGCSRPAPSRLSPAARRPMPRNSPDSSAGAAGRSAQSSPCPPESRSQARRACRILSILPAERAAY